MNHGKVSVIIPCYNQEKFITEAVESVIVQSYSDIECIIIDDGSTDQTWEILQDISQKYSNIKIFRQDNLGPNAARNYGIKKATGDFIAFLDSDDKWTKNKISNQILALAQNNADIVYSNYSIITDNQIKPGNEKITKLDIYDFIERNPINGSASSILMKKSVFYHVGLFDNRLYGAEDLDYWFRCYLYGYKFTAIDKNDVLLRIHAQNSTKNNLMMFYNHLYCLEKQINLIKDKNLDKKKLKKAIHIRLAAIRWYAANINRYDLVILTHLWGINIFKFKYFNKYTIMAFFKHFFKLLKKH